MTAPLAAIMVSQKHELPNQEEVNATRNLVSAAKHIRSKQLVTAVEESLAPEMARPFKQAQGKGASTWLSALPLEDLGFTLNKGKFRDAIAIRYGLPLESLPSICPCDKPFNLDHALNCKRGGFVIMRHNNIRDFEANLLSQVCTDVEK